MVITLILRYMRIINLLTALSLLLLIVVISNAQSEDDSKTWDNQLYIGNKIANIKKDWRYSGELQVRLRDNMQYLDNWFLEGVATYMISEKWELVPDLRFSVKPSEVEFRPGFGVIYKVLSEKIQFVNQFK